MYSKDRNSIMKYIVIFFFLLFVFTSCIENNKSENNIIYSIPEHNKINALYNDKISIDFSYDDINDSNITQPYICWYKNAIEIKCGADDFNILSEQDAESVFTVTVIPKPSSVTFRKTKTDTIYIKQMIDPTNIQESFSRYINVYTDKMRDYLKKNDNGYSNTIILYEVQVHLQNAAIYADERADIDMLHRILNLVKIAFEDQSLSNGMWLDSVGNREGTEEDLFIAQFFGLLTRVLSACERHGIDTDFSQNDIEIIQSHINNWVNEEVNLRRINDLNLFTIISILQFHDYLQQINYKNSDFLKWKKYVEDYMRFSVEPKLEQSTCVYSDNNYSCGALDRTGFSTHPDFAYAGYGRELKKISSDSISYAMFNEDGIAKHPKKTVPKVSMDLSHARRVNWFYEVIKRFGQSFNVSLSENTIQSWANNLAFRVSRGSLDNPYFTTFSDGIDGWYRVNYRDREHFGYEPGEMDIHFVGSSYGFFGIYNPKIYDWMESWVDNNKSSTFETSYASGNKLDYLLSLLIDIRKPLIGININ